MKNLLIAVVLAGIVGCSTTSPTVPTGPAPVTEPRFKVGDAVSTPSGPGHISKVSRLFAYEVEIDNSTDQDGKPTYGSWREYADEPFDGVQPLKK